MFGLLFVGIAGSTIILVSYTLEPMVALLHRMGRLQDHGYLEWTANSTLQLQRLAHSAVGASHWSGANSHVPITEPGEVLASLDTTDPEQPVLHVENLGSDSETLYTSEVAA